MFLALEVAMPNDSASEIALLNAAYAAFNARDIDGALATMAADVAWPKAFEGGFVEGGEAIREYWTRQWSGIDPHVEPVCFHPDDLGRVVVDVHQVVRDLDGKVVDDRHVGHLYTFKNGLIQRMEICPMSV
jgi:hypothetical protein